MAYIKMTGLKLPDDGVTVWRYMDLSKFKSILITSGLHFARADSFSDKCDSVLPRKWLKIMQQPMYDGSEVTLADWYKKREIPTNPILCWNCDKNENAQMWREYVERSNGLVIRSTVGRLKRCFSSTSVEVRIGKVNYGYHDDLDDPEFVCAYFGDDAPAPKLNVWYVSRYIKRTIFDYEKEIRASIHVPREDQPIEKGYILVIGSSGIRTLIESIRMHPNATMNQRNLVKSLLDQYGYCDIPVQSSTLKWRSK